MRPRCAHAPQPGAAPLNDGDTGALLKLGLRAFALPLALFALAALALAHWRVGHEDWAGVAALAVALWCGWRASRLTK
jgi:hypothetical protein